jgi:hypothetical protein
LSSGQYHARTPHAAPDALLIHGTRFSRTSGERPPAGSFLGITAQLPALLPTRTLAIWLAFHFTLSQSKREVLLRLLAGKSAGCFVTTGRVFPPNPVEPAVLHRCFEGYSTKGC